MASLFFFIPDDNSRCIWQKEINTMQFYGIVEAKYLDSTQHSVPILKVRNIETDKLDTIALFGDRSDAFLLINIADTISKKTNSSEIYSVKEGQQVLVAKVDFGCEQK